MTILRSPRWLSSLAKEFTAATRKIQSSSKELRHSGIRYGKHVTNESYYTMPYYSWADAVRLLAERYDTKSNVILCGFDPSFKCPTCLATLKSCDTTKRVCLWMTIYTYLHFIENWFGEKTWCAVKYLFICRCPPTRHDLTHGQKPEGRLKWG